MREIEAVSTQRAARVAGVTLLLLMASGFTGMAIGGHIFVFGDAAATATNLAAHGTRFRLGQLFGVVMLNCDVVLALALYRVLKQVSGTLALLGSFWRIGNATLLAVGFAANLLMLQLMERGPRFAAVFSAEQAHALGMVFEGLASTTSETGLMLFCLGAGVHSWLLWKSRMIPRVLSGLYLFACVEMLVCGALFVVWPQTRAVLDPWFLVPDVPAELFTAVWLTWRGVKVVAN